MARALVLLAMLAAAATSAAALSCGSTLTDVVMSGCNACTEINATRGSRRHGGGWRKLLDRGLDFGGSDDGPEGRGFGGSALVPSCTVCDAAGNFVLVTRDETNPIGRCECADTYGTVNTANATVTINNETRTVPIFSCVKCDAGQVPLGPKSNLRYTYNGTLVLINTTVTSTVTSTSKAAGGSKGFTAVPAPNATATARRNRTHKARRAGANSINAATVGLAALAFPSAATADIPAFAAAAAAAAEPAAVEASSVADGAAAAHRGGGGLEGPGGRGGEHGGPGGDFGGGFDGHRGHGGHGQCVACPTGSATTDGITCVATA